MDISTAKTAGALAAQIDARQAMLATVASIIAGGQYRVCQLRVAGPDGSETSLLLDTLDVPTSQQGLAFVQQLYQAQLAALQSQLAGM